MAELDISKATVSDLTNQVSNYSVESMVTDGSGDQEETTFQHTKWPQYYGYYCKIPELKKAIDVFATWVMGKGFEADVETQVILDHITGWGEDTFLSIMWNMIVNKKIIGDSFAEIIRDEDSGTLINLKVLDPSSIKIVVNKKGIIKRYEQTSKKQGEIRKFKPEEILHLCNERVADNIHGNSIIEACESVILARNEAMSDWRTVLHRNVNPLKLIYVDTDDQAKIDALQLKYEKAINLKEVIFVPLGTMKVEVPAVQLQDSLSTIKYLENFFYQAVGIPKIILGGSEEFTEASSKIAYLTFEQIYVKEQKELQADLWNQLQLKIELNLPASLKNEMLSSEEKNTGQTSFQQNELNPAATP